jgi:hypothetical protein
MKCTYCEEESVHTISRPSLAPSMHGGSPSVHHYGFCQGHYTLLMGEENKRTQLQVSTTTENG